MLAINPTFWAKKQDNKGRFEWLSLAQHLEDTRQIIRLLWIHWLSEGQRQNIIKSLSIPTEDVAISLVEFLGAIHDLGKATPAFQLKTGFVNSADLDSMLIDKLEGAGFSDLRLIRLANPEKSPHALAGQYLLSEYGVREDIASIIGAHHGKPVDDNNIINNQSGYESNYFQIENPNHPGHQKWKREQRRIFDWALEVSGFESIDLLPTIKQPGQVLLSGLLIMADWVASNEKYFPLFSPEIMIVENQKMRFEEGFMRWYKDASYPWSANYNPPETLYNRRFSFVPHNVQSVFAKIIEKTEEPGIFILEAPMGLGKTEAALTAVEQLARKTGRSGIFFGLPTQATSNGIFPRIKDWLAKVTADTGDSQGLRLLHGKAALNEEYTDLAKRGVAQNIDLDGDEKGTVTINEWFSGRKVASLDDFVVGTVDQFLMVALKQKHLALRHLGFSKKVVVIDEVHAYDAYMSQYLYQAVRWMGAYGVPVVILSATLPSDRRMELVEQYIRGAGYILRDCIYQENGLATDDYPLITYSDGNAIKQVCDFVPIKNKSIQIVRYENEDLIPLVEGLIREGGVIGIIVNTVKRAQMLAIECTEKFGSENVELLHSGFIATDRIDKERQLIDMIGKGAKRPSKKIIIGTQVIEQSLDIDFDVLISDLAPMDLLIQRVGRLHRHDILRPQKHEHPVLYVLGMDSSLSFDPGSEAVYGGYLLARTQSFLQEVLSIPEDISPLVQKVYGEKEHPDFSGDIQLCYTKMETEYKALLENRELKAKTYRIEDPLLRQRRGKNGSLIGWLKNSNLNESEEKAYAQVRDTQETVEIIALQQVGSGYGFFGTEQDISDRIDDEIVAKKIAKHTLRLPNVLSSTFRKKGSNQCMIDRTIEELEKYNSCYLKDWQSQSWLKGSLGILFDKEHCFELNGYMLKYDKHFGLTYEEVKDE
jgi:CRISPR-associated endonuclease/helicase Cas3